MPVRESKYRELALQAVQVTESDNAHRAAGRLRNKDNMAIYFFLRCIVDDVTSTSYEEQANWAGTLKKALCSVRDHPMRVYDARSLGSLKFIGPAIQEIVKSHLWSIYPPEPLTAEEAVLEQQQEAAEAARKAEEKRRKAELRKANKAAAKATGASPSGVIGSAAAGVPLPLPLPQGARGNGVGALASSPPVPVAGVPGASGDAPAAGGRKRKGPKKPYSPQLGTANYAFLITLYQARTVMVMGKRLAHMDGAAFLTKAELMRRADASGLASRPGAIYGTQAAAVPGALCPQYTYDGWSGVPRLENNEPPLLQLYSNPKKAKLTVEGFQMAAALHADAIGRGTVPPLPLHAVPPPPYHLAAAAVAGDGGAGAAQPAALPAVAAAAQQPRKRQKAQRPSADNAELDALRGSHPQHGFGGGASPASPPAPAAAAAEPVPEFQGLGLASQGASQQLMSQASQDENVARLMEMGYCANKADKALRASGNCVETALDIIDLSDSDDDSGPAIVAALPQQPASRARVLEPPRPARMQEAAQKQPLAHPVAAPAVSNSASSDCEIIDCDEFPMSQPVAAGLSSELACNSWQPKQHVAAQQPRRQASGSGAAVAPALPPSMVAPAAAVSAAAPQQQPQQAAAARPMVAAAPAAAAQPGRSTSGVLSAGRPLLPPLVDAATGAIADATVRLPPLPPGARFADVYDIVLLVDNREQFRQSAAGRAFAGRNEGLAHHLDVIRRKGVDAEVAHLATGDAAWVARPKAGRGEAYVLDYLLERKAAGDLASSIKDGRYGRQKVAMRATGLRRLLYVLEGEPGTLPSAAECQSVKTAAVETEVWAGFEVLHTANIGATVTLFAELTAAIQAKYGPLRSCDVAAGQPPLPTPAQLRAGVLLQGRQSVRDWWGLALASLRGVGPETAEAVLRVYPTPRSLYEAWLRSRGAPEPSGGFQCRQARGPSASPVRLLEGIEVFAGGTKVSQALSQKVIEALFGA